MTDEMVGGLSCGWKNCCCSCLPPAVADCGCDDGGCCCCCCCYVDLAPLPPPIQLVDSKPDSAHDLPPLALKPILNWAGCCSRCPVSLVRRSQRQPVAAAGCSASRCRRPRRRLVQFEQKLVLLLLKLQPPSLSVIPNSDWRLVSWAALCLRRLLVLTQ